MAPADKELVKGYDVVHPPLGAPKQRKSGVGIQKPGKGPTGTPPLFRMSRSVTSAHTWQQCTAQRHYCRQTGIHTARKPEKDRKTTEKIFLLNQIHVKDHTDRIKRSTTELQWKGRTSYEQGCMQFVKISPAVQAGSSRITPPRN